ncbi:uncharacterized protein BKCO1_6300029 [Diplodia corticola]|uniref:Uncharacterized protein n=1 Tax=Diplodia corticola TaxID=236234 RepID=A0A1J9QQG1_9PEZI|nr:uncharacterized protein BKCO1_6300029 [Diplodia corticola]OJD30266.1 hypothetical protein BKCO1_6300029 [Diplodia corticola]
MVGTVMPVREITVNNDDGSVTIYGETRFPNDDDDVESLQKGKKQKLGFSKHFQEPPIVVMSAATNCHYEHHAGDVHLLAHVRIEGNLHPGIKTDGFFIITHESHDGQILVNWIATGYLEE